MKVVEGLDLQVILGIAFGEKHKISIDCGDDVFKFNIGIMSED